MNHKQRTYLWIGIIVCVLMGLFPPCYDPEHRQGYTFLFLPLIVETWARVDIHRLCVQWLMVAVVTGGLMLTFHEGKVVKRPDKSEN